jgi:hypothetical protein
MGNRGLSPLQRRVLEVLAGAEPPWTLTGGGALVGVHLQHRTTSDLDLFWHGQAHLGPERENCIRTLRAEGFEVESVQREPAFERLIVSAMQDRVVVDLVAEPVPTVESPEHVEFGPVTVLVDTPHEILVNKLCALLGRSEIRDLQDVQAILGHGGDLSRALGDAPRKDGGFSPVTLAWVLRGLPIELLADSAGLSTEESREMARFRDELVDKLVSAAQP